MVDQVAVVEGLQAEVLEVEVALRLDRGAEAFQVELQQLWRQQLLGDRLLDVADEGAGVERARFVEPDPAADRLGVDAAQQAAGGDRRVGGIVSIRARAARTISARRRSGGRPGAVPASTSSAITLAETRSEIAGAGLGDPGAEQRHVEQDFLPVGVDQAQPEPPRGGGRGPRGR